MFASRLSAHIKFFTELIEGKPILMAKFVE
jgi:hypothetical protein